MPETEKKISSVDAAFLDAVNKFREGDTTKISQTRSGWTRDRQVVSTTSKGWNFTGD